MPARFVATLEVNVGCWIGNFGKHSLPEQIPTWLPHLPSIGIWIFVGICWGWCKLAIRKLTETGRLSTG